MTLGELKKLTLAAVGAIAMIVPAFAELPELAVPIIKNNFAQNYTYLAAPYSKKVSSNDGIFITHQDDVRKWEPNYVWRTVNKDLEKRFGKPTSNSHKTLLGNHTALTYDTKDGQYLHVIKDTVEGNRIVAVRACQDNFSKCLFTPMETGSPDPEACNIAPQLRFNNHCQSATVAAILKSRGMDVSTEEVGAIIGFTTKENVAPDAGEPFGYDYGRLAKYGIKVSQPIKISEAMLKKSAKDKEPLIIGGNVETVAGVKSGHAMVVVGYNSDTKLVKIQRGSLIEERPLADLIKEGFTLQQVKSPNLGHPLDTKSPGIKVEATKPAPVKAEAKAVQAPVQQPSYQPAAKPVKSTSYSSELAKGTMNLSQMFKQKEAAEPDR